MNICQYDWFLLRLFVGLSLCFVPSVMYEHSCSYNVMTHTIPHIKM